MSSESAGDGTLVFDSSAFVAILRNEPDADDLLKRALTYRRCVMAAPTWLETAIVCESKYVTVGDLLDQLAGKLQIEVLPFTAAQAAIARQAYRQFGKGRGQRGSLNFGDCFAYALAKDIGAPLLFKGNDFNLTDVTVA
ncbi:MAG: type II toxin-antitoxin system VapC family toxin [Pseudolabrys sp.]|nr:type II toxin-antitoxin system VapC family toxin [Pseudolabrys sp.]